MRIIVLIAALLACAGAASAKEYVIDWKLPSLATPARDSWPPLDVAVGDTVVFQWKGGLAYALYRIAKPVCLENEKAFEAVKDLVVKEYNHAKPEGKLTWKADKVGAYHFTDPDKCGQGLSLTVNVVDAAAPKGARKLMVAA